MMTRVEYKIIQGEPGHVELELNRLAEEGWEPIFVNTVPAGGAREGISVVVTLGKTNRGPGAGVGPLRPRA